MLPVGRYTAKALQAELGFADTGTELVAVQFEITEGEHKGSHIVWRGYFAEKTAKRVTESLSYTGWAGNWDTWEGLGTTEVQLDVQEDRDMKTGEIRGTRVAWVNQLKAPIKNAMDQNQRRAFAAKMRGMVAEVMGTHGTAAPPVQQQPRRMPAANAAPGLGPARQPPARRPPVNMDADYPTDADDNIPF
jgi:hypothetical protein